LHGFIILEIAHISQQKKKGVSSPIRRAGTFGFTFLVNAAIGDERLWIVSERIAENNIKDTIRFYPRNLARHSEPNSAV